MTPRTATLSPTEPAMWRKLLAAAHPDYCGSHDLFIWAQGVKEAITGSDPAPSSTRHEPPPQAEQSETSNCIEFDEYLDFSELTEEALELAENLAEPYASVLELLHDCEEAFYGTLQRQQEKGATYKQLAAIGHSVGMSKAQRIKWYRIAKDIPLNRRHAGHILSKLKEDA